MDKKPTNMHLFNMGDECFAWIGRVDAQKLHDKRHLASPSNPACCSHFHVAFARRSESCAKVYWFYAHIYILYIKAY